MNILTTHMYILSPGERAALSDLLRREAARYAKVDAERIAVHVTRATAVSYREETPYVRAHVAECTIDGITIDNLLNPTQKKIKWWVQQVMFGAKATRLPVNEAHMGEMEFSRTSEEVNDGVHD